MDSLRQERARSVQIDKLKCLIKGLKESDSMNGLCERTYLQCASGNRETNYSITQLIRSGNLVVDKVLMAFTSLANEVDLLMHEAKSKFYDCLLLYGEEYIGSGDNGSDGGCRCYEVLRCILSQLHGFFKLAEFDKAKERPLTRLWRCLGDSAVTPVDSALGCLLSIYFCAMDKRLKPLLAVIAQVDLLVYEANIPECCQQNFGEELMNNKLFLAEKFQKTIIEMLNGWDN
uniref:WASH complex subunit 4 N-terminal domain-containing protein n=1 Tax=Ditylenchus dipsaci TaxID=166011 RepID=A0A915CU35_9BILA